MDVNRSANFYLESLNQQRPHQYASRLESMGLAVKTLQEFLSSSNLNSHRPLAGKFVVLGIPDDRGVIANGGHPGAAKGPEAFRAAFYKLYDTYVREFCPRTHRPYPNMERNAFSQPGVLLSSLILDAGNIRLEANLEKTHEKLADTVEWLLLLGAELVFVIGGGHDFTYGSYTGHERVFKGLLPIINLDAHFDLRPVRNGIINSGTAFYRIIEDHRQAIANGRVLLELGLQRDRNPPSLYEYAFAHEVVAIEYLPVLKAWRNIADAREISPLEHVLDHLDFCSHLGWNRRSNSIHLSVDLDMFSSWIAPGTSASTPFGAVLDDVGPVFSFLGRTHMCRVVDFAELCPIRDEGDRTASLAASLVYEFALLREEYAAPEAESLSE